MNVDDDCAAIRVRRTFLRLCESCRRSAMYDERGQGMVEYALILVLIAIVVIVILQVVGQQVNNVFSNVSNGLAA
jgi:pilus assembly protein Flp/PilA